MSLYRVLRSAHLMKESCELHEAEKEYEALTLRHPHQPIQLVKLDVLKATPAQQEFNQKVGIIS